jgi:hypothetical protein
MVQRRSQVFELLRCFVGRLENDHQAHMRWGWLRIDEQVVRWLAVVDCWLFSGPVRWRRHLFSVLRYAFEAQAPKACKANFRVVAS